MIEMVIGFITNNSTELMLASATMIAIIVVALSLEACENEVEKSIEKTKKDSRETTYEKNRTNSKHDN